MWSEPQTTDTDRTVSPVVFGLSLTGLFENVLMMIEVVRDVMLC